MYPLVIIFTVAIIKKIERVYELVLPFSVLGAIVALYHYLLYMHLIPESYAPCRTGISCTTQLIQWFGFINIPFLSLIGFILITFLMILNKKSYEQGK